MPDTPYRPETSHERLGPAFYDPVEPARFPAHLLRYRNDRAAATVGLERLTDAEWLAHFGRFEALPGSFATPLALRYHGHQFRSYNPDLGDGRGFLFAQMRDADGRLLDLGTKGSGETPWSRRGDGRLTLKGGVREVLAAEMLQGLGVETSKALSLVETGEQLYRHDEPSPTRSSVLVRLSHSHIRIGTFQRFAYLKDEENLAALLDHTVATYLPEIRTDDRRRRALQFFEIACARVARMAAQWMAAGFAHGVLNSDNINVLGESFDYGPWRFVPTYDPNFVAAYYDETGLYAFGRQPSQIAWTLARLGECLLPFAEVDALSAILDTVGATMGAAYASAVTRRLGLASQGHATDSTLAQALATFMVASQIPFEQVFFDWFGGPAAEVRAARSPAAGHYRSEAFEACRAMLLASRPDPAARLDHAYFKRETPTTLLIAELEAIWDAIAERDDWQPFTAKIAEAAVMGEAYGFDRGPA